MENEYDLNSEIIGSWNSGNHFKVYLIQSCALEQGSSL
jgi:hypothetical protein